MGMNVEGQRHTTDEDQGKLWAELRRYDNMQRMRKEKAIRPVMVNRSREAAYIDLIAAVSHFRAARAAAVQALKDATGAKLHASLEERFAPYQESRSKEKDAMILVCKAAEEFTR